MFKNLFMLLVLTTVYCQANAQASSGPFWVIEGNPHSQDFTMIRYYAADRRLIAEERVALKWIDISRKRNIRMLNKRLQQKLVSDSVARTPSTKKKRSV